MQRPLPPIRAPRDLPELVSELKDAGSRRERRVVRGRGSRPIVTPGAIQGSVILSLANIAGIVELDAEEMVLTAKAGTRLAEVEAALASCGLFLPPLGIGDPRGTVGGLFNDPRERPFAGRWGRTRDAVLGVEAVRPDGVGFKAGGRVVKNVTGYDLTRLLCGSRGGLAVAIRLHWRLLPRPEAFQMATVRFAKPEAGWIALDRLRKAPFDPLVVAVNPSGDALEIRVVECGRRDAISEHLRRQIEVLLENAPASTPAPRISNERPDDLGGPAGSAAIARSAHDLLLRIRLPFSRWREISNLPAAGNTLTWEAIYPFVHFGIARLSSSSPATALISLRHALGTLGGSVSLEAIPADWPDAVDPWGGQGGERALSEKLRREWDPHGVLVS